MFQKISLWTWSPPCNDKYTCLTSRPERIDSSRDLDRLPNALRRDWSWDRGPNQKQSSFKWSKETANCFQFCTFKFKKISTHAFVVHEVHPVLFACRTFLRQRTGWTFFICRLERREVGEKLWQWFRKWWHSATCRQPMLAIQKYIHVRTCKAKNPSWLDEYYGTGAPAQKG